MQMRSEDVCTTIRRTVREMAPNPEGWIGDDPRLAEDLEYHSLALVELAFVLEDEFGLPPIDEASAVAIRTAGDVERYVVKALAAQNWAASE